MVGQFSTCEFRRAARAAVRELSFGLRAMNARLDGAVFGCDSIRHARQFVDSLSASSPAPAAPTHNSLAIKQSIDCTCYGRLVTSRLAVSISRHTRAVMATCTRNTHTRSPPSSCSRDQQSRNNGLRLLDLKTSPYSNAERRVPELIPVPGSQPAGDVSHKPGGRLPLLSARPAVTPATLKRAATNFAARRTEARWV